MTVNLSLVFDRAADVISQPGTWVQFTDARAADGRCVDAKNPEAVCWSAFGALRLASGTVLQCLEAVDYFNHLDDVAMDIQVFNDRQTNVTPVVEQLRRAAFTYEAEASRKTAPGSSSY